MSEEKEEYKTKNQLPEAPASINVRFYYHRFDVQATVRDETLAGAWEKLTWLVENKLIPHTKVQPKFGNKVPSEPAPKKAEAKADEHEKRPKTKECPVHPGMLLHLKEKGTEHWYSHKLDDGTWCNGKPKK